MYRKVSLGSRSIQNPLDWRRIVVSGNRGASGFRGKEVLGDSIATVNLEAMNLITLDTIKTRGIPSGAA